MCVSLCLVLGSRHYGERELVSILPVNLSVQFFGFAFESRHDKTNKVSVRQAKAQISLVICPVWSESSQSNFSVSHLCRDMTKQTKWVCAKRKLRSALSSAHADLSLRWAHTHFDGFVMSWLIVLHFLFVVGGGLWSLIVAFPGDVYCFVIQYFKNGDALLCIKRWLCCILYMVENQIRLKQSHCNLSTIKHIYFFSKLKPIWSLTSIMSYESFFLKHFCPFYHIYLFESTRYLLILHAVRTLPLWTYIVFWATD